MKTLAVNKKILDKMENESETFTVGELKPGLLH